MAEIEKKPVKIVETILRDAHQSLIATRMTTEQMLPIVDKLDKVGYHAVECWGGATFDASLRFLHEDPWERLRKLRDGFKNTKLQMLFRGQNILGYRPYADDVVEYFVQKSLANGIDIIRIFDCMNDLRNLQTAVKAANKEKADIMLRSRGLQLPKEETYISYDDSIPYSIDNVKQILNSDKYKNSLSHFLSDLESNCFNQTEKLINNYKHLLYYKKYHNATLDDISKEYITGSQNPYINAIGNELKEQELVRCDDVAATLEP